MKIKHLAIFGGLLALIVGCGTTNVSKLEKSSMGQGIYETSLAQEYLGLSKWLQSQKQYSKASKIAEKGLTLARHEDIELSEPPRNASQSALLEAYDAKLRFDHLLDSGLKISHPSEAAKGFGTLDCWIMLMGSPWASSCRQMFYTALHEAEVLTSVLSDRGAASEIQSREKIFEVQLPQISMLFFQNKTEHLTLESQKDLLNLIEVIEALQGEVAIQITGYTDGKGAENENLDLSLQRALYVEEELRQAAVNIVRIDVEGQGEFTPLVYTAPDNIDPLNRRVTVVLY